MRMVGLFQVEYWVGVEDGGPVVLVHDEGRSWLGLARTFSRR